MALVAVVVLIAGLILGVGQARAQEAREYESGIITAEDSCLVHWYAESAYSSRIEEYPEYANVLEYNSRGGVVYQNSGWIQDVAGATDPGWFRLDHFPTSISAPASRMTWRINIGTSMPIDSQFLTVRLPDNQTVDSIAVNPPNWMETRKNLFGNARVVNWMTPTEVPPYTVSEDGHTYVFDVGQYVGNAQGVVLLMNTSFKPGFSYEDLSVAYGHMTSWSTDPECVDPEPGNGVGTEQCTVDWTAEGSLPVTNEQGGIDEIRRTILGPADGMGTLELDGQTTLGAEAGDPVQYTGAATLTLDEDVRDATWTIGLDPDIEGVVPTVRESTIDLGEPVYDAGANTLTYTFDAQAGQTAIVDVAGTMAPESYTAGKEYLITTNLVGQRVPGGVADCPGSPAITVESEVADASGDGVADVGEELEYTHTITNTGDVEIYEITVFDGLTTEVITLDEPLAPGESTTVTTTYTVGDAGYTDNEVTNPVTVNARSEFAGRVSDESNSAIPLANDVLVSEVVLTDEDGDGVATAGEEITATYTVRNDGDRPLTDVTIEDPVFGTIVIGDLEPGEEQIVERTYTVTDEDVATGKPIVADSTTTGANANGDEISVEATDQMGVRVESTTTVTTTTSLPPVTETTEVTTTATSTVPTSVTETVTTTVTTTPTGEGSIGDIAVGSIGDAAGSSGSSGSTGSAGSLDGDAVLLLGSLAVGGIGIGAVLWAVENGLIPMPALPVFPGLPQIPLPHLPELPHLPLPKLDLGSDANGSLGGIVGVDEEDEDDGHCGCTTTVTTTVVQAPR